VIPWVLLGQTLIPGSRDELQLWQRGTEFSIRVSNHDGDLMNSRMHGSEDALAHLGCEHLKTSSRANVLIGGLGMGFTLAAALNILPVSATVTVAELVPEVVTWNRGALGECAGQPLLDPRASVHSGDVSALLKPQKPVYDAILLDVDNGPNALTRAGNHWLYSAEGLVASFASLRKNGVLAVWSVAPDDKFTLRLERAGFAVRTVTARARPGKGARHTIWLASKG
jgi:spermidine synthase